MTAFNNLTIAAKIRWRMKYDRNPLLTIMQDKLAVKNYAAERGVPSAEVFFITTKPETIPFDDLPEKCFIKANHGRNWNILKYGNRYVDFMDGEHLVAFSGYYDLENNTVVDLKSEQITTLCAQRLQIRYRPVEWSYNNIPPAIFVECLIEPETGKETLDYRCYTFRGKVAAISIGSPSMRKKNENIFFDTEWKNITPKNNFEKEPETIPEKPPFLAGMVAAAGRLGKDVDFVRIDFFADSRQFYLSEMTIYPNGGQDNRPTSNDEFNRFLGKQWKMSLLQLLQTSCLEIRHKRSMSSV